jgi:hypothetical protein
MTAIDATNQIDAIIARRENPSHKSVLCANGTLSDLFRRAALRADPSLAGTPAYQLEVVK